MTTTDQLAAIQARADAATEGPWHVDDEEQTVRAREYAGEIVYDRSAEHPSEWAEFKQTAEFIAHARADVPALLALVREQQARIERGLAACDRVIDNADGHKPPGPPHPTQQQATAVRIRASLTATEGEG